MVVGTGEKEGFGKNGQEVNSRGGFLKTKRKSQKPTKKNFQKKGGL